MKRFLLVVAGLAFLSVTGLSAQDAAQVAAGKKVYAAATSKCSTCHSIAGVGNKKYPLDGVGKKLSADDIKKWLTSPTEMEAKLPTPPPIKMSSLVGKSVKLKDADVNALVAYLGSLK